MDYWQLREIVKTIVPRMSTFEAVETTKEGLIREKGRKSNYHQFNLDTGAFEKSERLLNLQEMSSFLEISLRSQACPMSLNLDVWDGLYCPHRCQYCYADAFRASLYTAFFDNVKEMGLRYCDPKYFKTEMDKLMKFRGRSISTDNEVHKAISLEMPIRFGIRFEDFVQIEGEKKIALQMLQYLSEHSYPIMVNTKSNLIGRDDYVRALADNEGKAAVHITMISNNEEFLRKVEPGAPPFHKRIEAARNLTSAGVMVVARIEPFMTFLNDEKAEVDSYLDSIRKAGIHNLTFDTYSYSAYNPGIRSNFQRLGFDFDRMFLLMSDSQWLGSLLLGKFMDYVRDKGFSCSAFDFGNVPKNNEDICCEVGTYFGKGFCYGNAMSAVRFISSRPMQYTSWGNFEKFVESKGGFLSPSLRFAVKELWNLQGNEAYALDWAAGLHPMGKDFDGLVWTYDPDYDFRINNLEAIL